MHFRPEMGENANQIPLINKMDRCSHPYRMRPAIHGFSHGLKTCSPQHVFTPVRTGAALPNPSSSSANKKADHIVVGLFIGNIELNLYFQIRRKPKSIEPQRFFQFLPLSLRLNLMYIIQSSNTRYLCFSSAQEYALRDGLFPEILFQDNPRNSHRKKWNPPAARRIQ